MSVWWEEDMMQGVNRWLDQQDPEQWVLHYPRPTPYFPFHHPSIYNISTLLPSPLPLLSSLNLPSSSTPPLPTLTLPSTGLAFLFSPAPHFPITLSSAFLFSLTSHWFFTLLWRGRVVTQIIERQKGNDRTSRKRGRAADSGDNMGGVTYQSLSFHLCHLRQWEIWDISPSSSSHRNLSPPLLPFFSL